MPSRGRAFLPVVLKAPVHLHTAHMHCESSSLRIKTFQARSANSPPWTSIFPYENVYQLFQAGRKESRDGRRTTLGRKKLHRLFGLRKVKTTTKALHPLVFLHATQVTRRMDTSQSGKPDLNLIELGHLQRQKRLLEHIIICILIKNHVDPAMPFLLLLWPLRSKGRTRWHALYKLCLSLIYPLALSTWALHIFSCLRPHHILF